jgi:hypothetical protein
MRLKGLFGGGVLFGSLGLVLSLTGQVETEIWLTDNLMLNLAESPLPAFLLFAVIGVLIAAAVMFGLHLVAWLFEREIAFLVVGLALGIAGSAFLLAPWIGWFGAEEDLFGIILSSLLGLFLGGLGGLMVYSNLKSLLSNRSVKKVK